jgi:putative CocE/NonD family hydrolase
VDADAQGQLLATAIAEHSGSFKMRDLAPEFAFREESALHDPGLHSGAFSPYWYLGELQGRVNILSVSGWYDGSSFANGAIARFLSNPGADNRLLLGPWDHGARTNGSPWRDGGPQPQFPVLGEVLRFFDEHLAGMDTGLRDEAPVHFHTVREEKWQAAATWPPHAASTRLYLAGEGMLAAQAPRESSVAQHQVSFASGTGTNSRFERLGALPVVDYYKDWNGREERMLTFATAPLDKETELSGHATVQLHVSTSEHDASLFVYLSEVDADGRSWFVTEGLLRLLHRAEGKPPASYAATWPWRSFRREDAKHMQPGVPEAVRFALLPVSWTLRAGSRLRLAIAGADADHFMQVPHGRPPRLEFTLGGGNGSFIDLPLRR